MLLRFQKAVVRGNYDTGNQAFSMRLRFSADHHFRRSLSSSRAPLLAPSPLRTGLEGFPSSGSSTQKRPPEKRGRGLMQNEADLLDTDLLPIRTAGNFACRV